MMYEFLLKLTIESCRGLAMRFYRISGTSIWIGFSVVNVKRPLFDGESDRALEASDVCARVPGLSPFGIATAFTGLI